MVHHLAGALIQHRMFGHKPVSSEEVSTLCETPGKARIMAPVGSEVDVFLSSGVFFFILLVFLSIFLTALCSECSRRSFELRDPAVNKDPSSLIRVVKLEDAMVARENPMIAEIQNDEKDSVSFTPWRSHLAAPQHHPDARTNGSAAVMKTETAEEVKTEEHYSAPFTPWRSHLNTGLFFCF
ncbi:uncharacterized protein [Pseudochaenichthys georgianus]|uniref:uncharacterized protein isoform X1 n=3 Tax=Pseudochaenichthys georgianus TaxID=52239 RepID=UPI00146C3225|nr:uncharacterized protein si:ch73-204p21.2 isoform X1 [Pseudochaenichthys georgianus]